MKNLIFTVLMASIAPGALYAATMALKSGELRFTAVASPGALKINGKGAAPEGRFELTELKDKYEVSGALKIKLDSLTTGLSLRDSHMKDKYLEAGKYPEALLTLSKQTLPKSGTGPFEGELVLHGVKQKVSGTAEARLENGVATVKASFPVKLQDFGIPIPSFAGVSVANDVRVETDFSATVLN